MLATYNDLVAYWETIPSLIPGIKFVVVGSDEAIIATQNTKVKYPCLWVETPAIAFVGTDENPATRFSFALVVMLNDPKKSNREGNLKLSAALNLLIALYNRVIADADGGLFDLVLDDVPGDPVRRWSNDNAYGWRLEPLKIDLPRGMCSDPIDEFVSPAITDATWSYVVPAGRLLLAIYVRSTAEQTVDVGTSEGGHEVHEQISCTAGEYQLLGAANRFAESDLTLYFSGLEGTNTIRVWVV